MVLVTAVLIGLILGLGRAWINKQNYRVYDLRAPGLVLLAFIPQFLIFFLPATRSRIPDRTASILFISSLIILIAFSIFNIRKTSFWPVTAGFLLNAGVILLNGGWMPISPAMVQKLFPAAEPSWKVGERLGFSKDILLNPEMTRLWFLSDRFTLPDWIHYRVAFSAGDLLIFIGIVWLLWSLGGKAKDKIKENNNE
ncbi:MAG TPA: DUF5317 domain-containing protein [Anaerolineaceae bacterium]|nr:DUF5317 domain-containing protein [Anaerolineaceae bacterium]